LQSSELFETFLFMTDSSHSLDLYIRLIESTPEQIADIEIPYFINAVQAQSCGRIAKERAKVEIDKASENSQKAENKAQSAEYDIVLSINGYEAGYGESVDGEIPFGLGILEIYEKFNQNQLKSTEKGYFENGILRCGDKMQLDPFKHQIGNFDKKSNQYGYGYNENHLSESWLGQIIVNNPTGFGVASY
jgi:hypothetical protein